MLGRKRAQAAPPVNLGTVGAEKPASPKKGKIRENVESLGTAVLLFLIFRTFVLQAFRIPSESMQDTLLEGDFLFVSKFTYGAKIPFTHTRLPGLRSLRRGDIVVFKNPNDRKTDYIKRCVAIAGDTVIVRDNNLFINGKPQNEPYTKRVGTGHPLATNWPPDRPYYVVPEDHFFAMGDNRNNSADSRFRWQSRDGRTFEPAVPRDLVVGKAMFIYASFDPEKYYLPRFARMFRLVR
jgi:signal peptidase I